MIRTFWHRLHAELASLRAAHEAHKQAQYKRALRKRRVVLPSPRPDTVVGNWYGDRKAQ